MSKSALQNEMQETVTLATKNDLKYSYSIYVENLTERFKLGNLVRQLDLQYHIITSLCENPFCQAFKVFYYLVCVMRCERSDGLLENNNGSC